jgi:Carboxypeptidase regulatory-like domain
MTLQFFKYVCTVFVCLFAVTTTFAQQALPSAPHTGTIVGTVEDVDGDTVPRARIVLDGPGQGDDRALVTQDNGFFKLDGLEPGVPYRVSVTAQGFSNWISNAVVLQPGQFFILSGITLRIRAVETTISVEPPEQIAVEQVKALEQQRILGFIPNFYVSYEANPVPLSAKLKFQLALRALVDPVTIAGFAVNAGIYQAADYPSGYQQGAKGFGQRLGATFAGGWTNVMVGDAILPSLLHQDPRYFFQGTGTTKSRLMHAISSAFVTKTDDGRQQINYSNIGGDLASGAIAYAYYPNRNRDAGLIVRSALIGAGGRIANSVLQEFLLHKITSRHNKENGSSNH